MATPMSFTGNVTRDVSLKFSNSGMAIAEFGVAINERKKDARGEWVDGDPTYFDVACFNSLAENVGECISRGQQVVVIGEIKQRHWEKDGEKKSKFEVVASAVGVSLQFGVATFEKVTA